MGGYITLPTTVVDRPSTLVRLEINLDEDWDCSFALTEGQKPLDLNGKRLELTVIPKFGFQTPICMLTSKQNRDISVDDASRGEVSIFVPQAKLAALVPAGKWNHFLVLKQDAVSGQPLKREVWRGELIARPGLGGL